jgi:ABC-type polysaccharide/polyol phosphate transport system ATPase subunit
MIRFDKVSKVYRRQTGPKLIKEHVREIFVKRHKSLYDFYALKNLSFHIKEGEGVAFLGHNGAGKSTALSLIAGLSKPDEGEVTVTGITIPLLELGAGFHFDLTGAENIELNASLLGYSRGQADKFFDQIVEFSGLGDFIHEQLRTYSSGMVMRLGFSIAVHLDASILLIDEILAVGDKDFQAKCMDRLEGLRRKGKTLVCVSHVVEQNLKRLCDRAIWLDHGNLAMDDTLDQVMPAYYAKRVNVTES